LLNPFAHLIPLGRDTDADWHARIKYLPAPWAEIENPNHTIFTVPSSVARDNMTNPQQLMDLWTKLQDYIDDLRGYYGVKGRVRTAAARYVYDTHISAGKSSQVAWAEITVKERPAFIIYKNG
jgi:hypothetical protein